MTTNASLNPESIPNPFGADLFSTRPILSIAVLGVAKTGKSNFISAVTKDFTPSKQSEKDITTKRRIDTREDRDNEFVKLCVYETNSIERFHAITKGYHRKWDIVFILYNSNFGYSLKRAAKWVNDIRSHGSQYPKLVLVENTFEIDHETRLSEIELQEFNSNLESHKVQRVKEFALNNIAEVSAILDSMITTKLKDFKEEKKVKVVKHEAEKEQWQFLEKLLKKL